MIYNFPAEIAKFNEMYDLPRPSLPKLIDGPVDRLKRFKEILLEEVNEVDDIVAKLESASSTELDVLTDIADWLGDIQVYSASEMLRWGIPWVGTLRCIMGSQWSKLGADGKPIVVNGKVQKGPNYVAPEPTIRLMLENPPVEPVPLVIHEDEDWQCEGYYGDGSQLYRHRTSRLLVRTTSLDKAREYLK